MASMNSSHSKYAPSAARVAPPIRYKPTILGAHIRSSTTKYRPATSIVIELINKLILLMLPHHRHVPLRARADCRDLELLIAVAGGNYWRFCIGPLVQPPRSGCPL